MANLSNINNKFLVTTGGNVLIGQTSAVGSSILQVTGASTFTPISTVSFIVTNSGNALRLISGIPSGVTWIGKPVEYYASEYSFSTDVTGVGGYSQQFVIETNGNVGIGETSPTTKLDIGGMADPVVRIKSGAGGDPQLRFDASQANRSARIKFYDNGSVIGGFIDYLHNGDKMNFGAGSSSTIQMTVTDGAVGIGTDSPGARIDIKGVAGSPATSGTTQNGILRIQNATNNNTLDIGQVAGSPYGTWLQAADKSDLNPIYTYPISLNPLGGNVGIGTDAPGAKLDVRGSGGGYLKFDTTGSDGTIKSDYNLKLYADDTGDNSSGFGNMQFFTAGANERMRIQSNGNVGIGVTGPTAKLQIGLNPDPSQTAESLVHLLSSTAPTTANGFNILKLDYLAGNVAGDAGATIIFNQGYHSGNIDYTAPVGALRGYRTGPNYSYGGGLQLLYQPDAGALGLLVGMTLTGNGYVGIGLTAPSARLNTGVNVVGSFLPYLNGTGTSFTTATNIITVHDSSALGTNTTAGLMLINNNNSNDAPSPLIAFSARSTSNTYNHTYAAIWGEKDSTGADTNWNTGSIIFATSTSTGPYERMRINPVGNVTIGTTNNAALLNVGGPILASDNGQTAGMYVTRNLTISHPGSSGTFTRTFNPVTQFGLNRSGAAVKIMASGWQGRLQAGYIVWRNNGGSSNLTAVYYYPSASSGLGETITVGVNAANDNTIDVTFTNWHGNSHGWYTKISVTQ